MQAKVLLYFTIWSVNIMDRCGGKRLLMWRDWFQEITAFCTLVYNAAGAGPFVRMCELPVPGEIDKTFSRAAGLPFYSTPWNNLKYYGGGILLSLQHLISDPHSCAFLLVFRRFSCAAYFLGITGPSTFKNGKKSPVLWTYLKYSSVAYSLCAWGECHVYKPLRMLYEFWQN